MDAQRFDPAMKKGKILALVQAEDEERALRRARYPERPGYKLRIEPCILFVPRRTDPSPGPPQTTPTAPEFAIPNPRALPAPDALKCLPIDENAEYEGELTYFDKVYYDTDSGRSEDEDARMARLSRRPDDILHTPIRRLREQHERKMRKMREAAGEAASASSDEEEDDDEVRGRPATRPSTSMSMRRRGELSRSLGERLATRARAPSDGSEEHEYDSADSESDDEEFDARALGAPPSTRRPSAAVNVPLSLPVAEKDVAERLRRLAQALIGARGVEVAA